MLRKSDNRYESIILFYEHKGREKKSLEKLASVFAAHGERRVGIFSVIYEWCSAIKFAKKYGVDLIFAPWIYSKHDFYPFVSLLLMNPSARLINLHQEQISSPSYENIMLPVSLDAKNYCHHFVWSKYFGEKLVNSGVDSSLIHTTGSMRLDDISIVNDDERKKNKKKLGFEFNLDPSKKWLLYAENRGWVENFSEAKLQTLLSRGISKNVVLRRKELFQKSLSLSMEQINSIPDSFFQDFELIYRPHPGTITNGLNNSKVKIISDLSIGDWLKCVDLVIVWSSTCAFEAEKACVPVVRHETIPNEKGFITYGLSSFPVIKDLSQIDEELVKKESKNQEHWKTYRKYYGECDGLCSTRVMRASRNLESCGLPPYSVKEKIACIIRVVKKISIEYITRVLVRTGFAKRLKRPKRLMNTYNDIPYSFFKRNEEDPD